MQKKMLVFDGKDKLAEFIIHQKSYGIIVNFDQRTLIGILTDKEIDLACEQYGAQMSSAPDFLRNDGSPL